MSEETILAPVYVAVASFCVWLAVRIINRREVWAITVAVLLAIGLALLATLMFVTDNLGAHL